MSLMLHKVHEVKHVTEKDKYKKNENKKYGKIK